MVAARQRFMGQRCLSVPTGQVIRKPSSKAHPAASGGVAMPSSAAHPNATFWHADRSVRPHGLP